MKYIFWHVGINTTTRSLRWHGSCWKNNAREISTLVLHTASVRIGTECTTRLRMSVGCPPLPCEYTSSVTRWFVNVFRTLCYMAGVTNLRLLSHMRLFQALFVTLDKCTRVPFSFLCFYTLKNYRSICVSKCILNYWQQIWKTKCNVVTNFISIQVKTYQKLRERT